MNKEKREVEIKNALITFIVGNFQLEGQPEPLKSKVIDIACGLYELFESYYTFPEKDLG